jgi:multiple sugar transport system permease protein
VTVTIAQQSRASSKAPPAERMRRAARRSYYITETAALTLAFFLMVWTLMPLYNMVMVSLESHGDVFTDAIWPPKPSVESFLFFINEGYCFLYY